MARRAAIAALLFTIAIVASCAKATVSNTPSCNAGETPCGTICVNTSTDSDNCGACNTVCPSPQACVSGKCTAVCPGNGVMCGVDAGKPTCVNTQTDNSNCGGCGKACPAGEFCHAGNCSSQCSSTETKCTPDGGTPYCTDPKTDNANCGACGVTCGVQELCASGQCVSACSTDQTLCSSDGGSAAYCANLSTDNANCGTCGTVCSGTLQYCSDGGCASQCSQGQTVCTQDGGPPYCADLGSDNTNCGTCGNVCPSNTPMCVGGKCSNANIPPGCMPTTNPQVVICISNNLVSSYGTAAHCAACTEKGLTNYCTDITSCTSLFTNNIVQTLYNYRTGLTCTAQTDQSSTCGWGEIMTPSYQTSGNCPTPQDCTSSINWQNCTYGTGTYSAYIYGVCKL